MEEVKNKINLVEAKILEVEKDLQEAKDLKKDELILARENRLAGLQNTLVELHKEKNLLLGSSAVRPSSPPVKDKVFILACRSSSGGGFRDGDYHEVSLVGTCFAVSRCCLISAGHNIWDKQTNQPLTGVEWVIGSTAKKINGRYCLATPIVVNILDFQLDPDWLVLEVNSPADYFNGYLPICPVDHLPDETNEREELKVYYAPIGQYKTNAFEDMMIYSEGYSRLMQYDRSKTVVVLDGGLCSGASGAPYISHDGYVVACHVDSMNEIDAYSSTKRMKTSVTILNNAVEQIEESVSQLSESHHHLRTGLVIAQIPDLMARIKH